MRICLENSIARTGAKIFIRIDLAPHTSLNIERHELFKRLSLNDMPGLVECFPEYFPAQSELMTVVNIRGERGEVRRRIVPPETHARLLSLVSKLNFKISKDSYEHLRTCDGASTKLTIDSGDVKFTIEQPNLTSGKEWEDFREACLEIELIAFDPRFTSQLD